jgi:hypothetical protein
VLSTRAPSPPSPLTTGHLCFSPSASALPAPWA